jgi:hypothetical protein
MPNHEEQIAVLPEDLKAIQAKWLAAGKNREEKERIYAEEFGLPFAALFARLPLHGAPADFEKPRYLVSVLGMSWQPVALMGAWFRPKKWLVVTTSEARGKKPAGENPLSIIRRISGVAEERITVVDAADDGEVEIYRHVRKFLNANRIKPKHLAVDITGGKKTMSVAAGLAGFLSGARIVYVDYGRHYSTMDRTPDAGYEYPRLLSDPLEQLGDIEYDRFTEAFNAGDYLRAQAIAEGLKVRLYESREAECLYEAATGYAEWDAFRFENARLALERSLDIYRRHHHGKSWRFDARNEEEVGRHVKLLGSMSTVPVPPDSIESGMPVILNHLAAAKRLKKRRPGISVLLCYATIEKYVDLCLLARHGLDPEKPEYEKVREAVEDRRKEYDRIGTRLVEKYSRRELEGPLMFTNGIQLLAFLSPELVPMNELEKFRGLSHLRNLSEYAHGSWTKRQSALSEKELDKHIELAKRCLACGMGRSMEEIEKMLNAYRFPELNQVVHTG